MMQDMQKVGALYKLCDQATHPKDPLDSTVSNL
jgi:hypothetical protein